MPYPKGEHQEIHAFLSLEEAVTTAKDWDNGWFPLFETDGNVFFIVGLKEKQRTSLIFCNDGLELPDDPRYATVYTQVESE